jgi:O-antigen/teichoic acid export membrane protein
MAERVTRIFVSLFVGILVARYLGPERFGLLNYALSLVALLSAFATLGLEDILIRDFVENPSSNEALLGTSFALRTLGSVLLIGLVYVVSTMTHSETETKILVLVVAAGSLFLPMSVIGAYFQSQVQARFVSYAQFISLALSSLARLLFILFQASLIWFCFAVVLENAFLGIGLLWFFCNRSSPLLPWRFNRDIAERLLRDSWPLILSSMAIMIYMRIDQVMIKALLSDEVVGHYAAAVRFSEAFYFIPVTVCASLFPAIIHARKGGKEAYYRRLQSLYDLMVILALVIAVPATFFADPIILSLLGPAYGSAAGVLKIHIWASVFVFLGVASGKWLLAENLQQYSLYRTCAGAFANVVLNLLLIPKGGAKGAAVATVISYSIAAYFSLAFFRKTRKAFWISTKALNPLAAQKRLIHAEWN